MNKSIKNIGIYDKDVRLFEGQYPVPEGMTYNSYLICDERVAVMDTVDARLTEQWLSNLERELEGRQPDYLIISHMEPDHSSGIEAFCRRYPNAKLVGNAKTFVMLERFFGKYDNSLIVKDSEELNLGKHTLRFILTPMVHWPEVMMSYESTDKILFSADAFGKFGAPASGEDWTDEARRYYFNIVGKYGAQVQSTLKKLFELTIEAIYPLHGGVLEDDLLFYEHKYSLWSSYRPESDGTLIAYASIYGNTRSAALRLSEELRRRGEFTELIDLTVTDPSYAVSAAFRYPRCVIASVSYDGGLFPAAAAFIQRLQSKNFRERIVGIVENGSWAVCAGRLLNAAFETMKDIIVVDTMTVNSGSRSVDDGRIDLFADSLLKMTLPVAHS